MTITQFLLARIAEDEREANVCLASPEHSTRRWVRMLAECAAKRAIVASCREDHEDAMASGDDTTALASEVLYALAAVYADHPDYLQEWKC